jgi:hypothetical protein
MASPPGRPGIIYVLINEAMPRYVKVGKTGALDRRFGDQRVRARRGRHCFSGCA